MSLKEKEKWVTKMLGHEFEIIYKKGKENIVANALSKKDEKDKALLCALSILQENWVVEAKEEWKDDAATSNLIQQIKSDPSSSDKFCLKGDILWYKEWCISARIPFLNTIFSKS